MIALLRGELVDRRATSSAAEAIVDVNGVGYRVTVSPYTLEALGPIGQTVMVHVHTHVREDAITLFGFHSADERRTFDALLGARGVGPSLALAILAVHRPAELARIVADEDLDSLCEVPGVGKKTAARLLPELADRLNIDPITIDITGVGVGAGGVASPSSDVRAALAQLGYGTDEIRYALGLVDPSLPVDQVLRCALRTLASVK